MRPDLKFPPINGHRLRFLRPMWTACSENGWMSPMPANRRRSRLDIYLPDHGDGPFPIILHIHGGGFAIGDKRDIHLVPYLRALQRGYAVVSVNYRLSDEAIFPAAVMDVKAAHSLVAGQQCRLSSGRQPHGRLRWLCRGKFGRAGRVDGARRRT